MEDFSEEVLDQFLSDTSKFIDDDIEWKPSDGMTAFFKSDVTVNSAASGSWTIYLNFNAHSQKMNITVVYKKIQRVYGLDIGQPHRDPNGELHGEIHKHTWTEEHGDKSSYEPDDITATLEEPEMIWEQFCEEINTDHRGEFEEIPGEQLTIL